MGVTQADYYKAVGDNKDELAQHLEETENTPGCGEGGS